MALFTGQLRRPRATFQLNFEPFTVTYPSAPTNSPLTQTTGPAVTMIAAVANLTTYTFLSETASSMVFAYTTATSSSSSESLFFEGFNASGGATNSGPVLIATLPKGDPFFIGYSTSSGYLYRYLEVGGALGTGISAERSSTTTGALGTASLVLALPTFTSFDGVGSFSISNGNSVRLVEGVSNGQDVIESFLNSSSTPQATFVLSSPSDFFRTSRVYDPTTGQLDDIALAYTDGSSVHLELLNEAGVQIGTDVVVPGITSFDRLNLMQASASELGHSTRVELDYTATDPSGGTEIKASSTTRRPRRSPRPCPAAA